MAGVRAPRRRYLVLQTRFSEFGESAAAFKACQRLARDGHDVLTTSTTTDKEEQKRERAAAAALRGRHGGGVTLIHPENDPHEISSTEWITTRLYKTYFSYLKSAELPRIDTLVTLMPGTTKTGVELIRDLRLRNSGGKPPAAADGGGSSLGSGGQGSVQLVLLACTKIGGDQTELYEEIEDIVKEADEVWSIGPDLYSHYDELFAGYSKKGMKRLKHKELIFTPEKPNGPEGKKKFWKNFFASGSLTRVVSLWQEGTPYQYRGNTVKAKSHGSSLEDYCCLCKALGKISAELFDRKRKLEWEILGPDDVIATMVSSIRSSQTKGKHTFQIQGVTLPSSAETLCNKKLIRSTVFIAPERTEDTFNFAAYEAIKFGIPTLVSGESSLGRVLRRLGSPVAPRALVDLTGDPSHDVDRWKRHIYEQVLSDPEEARTWAKELSKSLVGSPEIRAYEENVFGPRAPPRGSSVEQEDARSTSSGTTLSDESPKHTPQSPPPRQAHAEPTDPEPAEPMRPRSASYGSRPARPAPRPEAQPPPRPGSLQPGYMHDETEDLNSPTVGGPRDIVRQISKTLFADAPGAPYSPIPEDSQKLFYSPAGAGGGTGRVRGGSDSDPCTPFGGSPKVPRAHTTQHGLNADLGIQRSHRQSTPPPTALTGEWDEWRARSRSLSGGKGRGRGRGLPSYSLLPHPGAPGSGAVPPGTQAGEPENTMVCRRHQKFFYFYCEDTSTPLCMDCANEPQNHPRNIVKLHEVEAKLKMSLRMTRSVSQKTLSDLSQRWSRLEQALRHVREHAERAERKIDERRAFTQNQVERTAQSMIAHVKSTAAEEERRIRAEMAELESALAVARKQQSSSHVALQTLSSTDFIKQAKVVLAQQENNPIGASPVSPLQAVSVLEFLPALTSTNDPSRAQVLIEDCLLGHLKRKAEQIVLQSDSMVNLFFDHPDGTATPQFSPLGIHHDDSLSCRSLPSWDLDEDELSVGSQFEEEQAARSKSESDVRRWGQEHGAVAWDVGDDVRDGATEHTHVTSHVTPHAPLHSFHVEKAKHKSRVPPVTATIIRTIPISSIKPALEGVLDICEAADGICIAGYYTPERWKTPHLCICKLNGFTHQMELIYDAEAKDATRPAVILDSNGKLMYAKRKDWRLLEINTCGTKPEVSVTYSMVTQRIGALAGAGRFVFFSDVSPANRGCIQLLKWKETGLCYKRTIRSDVNTLNYETIHLGLVCSPTPPPPPPSQPSLLPPGAETRPGDPKLLPPGTDAPPGDLNLLPPGTEGHFGPESDFADPKNHPPGAVALPEDPKLQPPAEGHFGEPKLLSPAAEGHFGDPSLPQGEGTGEEERHSEPSERGGTFTQQNGHATTSETKPGARMSTSSVAEVTSATDDNEPEICMLIVSDSGSDPETVTAVDTDGFVHWTLSGPTDPRSGGLDLDPAGVCADPRSCNVYVADRANHRVLVVTPNGRDVHCLLGPEHGIKDPSQLCVSLGGAQLAVLHRRGKEIALCHIEAP